MWHLLPKIMYFCGDVYICIYVVFVSLEDSIFMGKCIYVVSVSEACAGVTYNIYATVPGSLDTCALLLCAIWLEGANICLTPWIGI